MFIYQSFYISFDLLIYSCIKFNVTDSLCPLCVAPHSYLGGVKASVWSLVFGQPLQNWETVADRVRSERVDQEGIGCHLDVDRISSCGPVVALLFLGFWPFPMLSMS